MAVFFKEPVRIFRKHSCHSERGATMVRRKSIMQKIAIDQCFYFPSYGTNVPSWLVSVLCCVSLSTRSNLMIGSALHNDMECQSLEKSVFCLSRTSLVWPIYRLRRDIFLAMVAPELWIHSGYTREPTGSPTPPRMFMCLRALAGNVTVLRCSIIDDVWLCL